ncbi:hypothetical protein AB9K41_30135 [Cribrihabitans sp. XS_ASV171]
MTAPIWTPASGTSLFTSDQLDTQIVKSCASARNIAINSVASPAFSLTHSQVTRHFFHHRPDTVSFFARQVSNSKFVTKAYLRKAGLPAPEGRLFPHDQRKAAWRYARALGGPVVVKPVTGSYGRGVTADIRAAEHFDTAWQQIPETRSVVVERHVTGNDYRLLVVGQSFVAAAQRKPASVTGDGVATISELIDRKNASRSHNPYASQKSLVLSDMMLYLLERDGMSPDSVLPEGQVLQLHAVANIGAGGDSVDVTGQVHPGFMDIALRAAHAIPGMTYAGIDVLAPDITMPPERQAFSICEVNTTPDLALHHFPLVGDSLDAVGTFLEHMFPLARPLPRAQWQRKLAKVSFASGFEAFRDAIAPFVVQNACAGRLSRTGETEAELAIAAPPVASRRFLRQVKALRGVKTELSDWLGEPPDSFEIAG